jgi:glycosyltransferase involved in cell wall biosynthesis
MLNAGLVSIDPERKWIGGRYYLQHLVRCVDALPDHGGLQLFDVWWRHQPDDDPFAEVRPLLSGTRVLQPPTSFAGRAIRRARRTLHGWKDSRDLFRDAGIDVVFPVMPCAEPGIAFVFWLSDFQYRHLPELFPDEMYKAMERHFEDNGRDADIIAVSSESGLRDLQRFMPQFAEKTRVLRFCSVPTPDWYALDPSATADKYELPERFFVLSNQFSHHKNHMVVLDAVRILRDRHGIDAVVACTGSTYGFRGDDYMQRVNDFIAEHNLSSSIRILGLIPREDQMALTRRAIAMLQPSRFEGWSTVVEDAKALGQTILLSDLDVHREQAPAGGTFLPLDDAEPWAARMAELLRERVAGPHLDEEESGRAYAAEAKVRAGATVAAIFHEAAKRHT